MESTDANGLDAVPTPGTDVLRAAAELRFGRPDLTAALARHLTEAAVAGTDRDGWLAAAAWWVHGVAAVGDGRDAASEVLEQLPHWGADALSVPAADRLRVELAVVAHDAGADTAARALLATPVTGPGPELAADVALASVRCLGAAADGDPEATVDAAVSAWARVDGPRGEVGAASATALAAALARRGGRAERAVGLAVDGLARLDRSRGGGTLTPSAHLAAALTVEWISALIDAGRVEQAREGSVPVRARLLDQARPTRQLALLRLTIARASASDLRDADADPADELERAAQDAAAADVPDLEHVCRTALGELYESQGRLDAALESIRLAVVADRRNQARAARLRAALSAASGLWAPAAATQPDGNAGAGPESSNGNGSGNENGNGSADRTAILRAVRSVRGPAVPPRPVDRAVGTTAQPSSTRSAPAGPTPDRRPSPRPVRTADPWATGSWTGSPVPASEGPASSEGPAAPADEAARPTDVERPAPSAAGPGDDAAVRPDGAVSGAALFAPAPAGRPADPEPDTWLATALAELDRIWGTPDTDPVPPTAEADGCVVVLDLARAGDRLPPGAVTPTLQRVARRLADRLPPRSRLRDDGPDALSVVLPGRDRAAASEWMHRVLPGLVAGLVVDDAVAGALLRAAVHDADGVVGAQVLQRLDGGSRAEEGRRAERGAGAGGWEPPQRAVAETDPAAAGDANGSPADRSGHSGRAVPGAGGLDRSPVDRSPVDPSPVDRGTADGGTVDGGTVDGGTVDGGTVDGGTADGSPVDGTAIPVPPRTRARHDESAGRPPYLPDGVVVRPGSGGRRHRRGPVEAAVEPPDVPDPAPRNPAPRNPASRSPAPQSTEGLGLADLLAGALAAYRGI